MSIALIDADWVARGKMTFPNVPLMKLSAWYKAQGHHVEWYDASKHYDLCYIAKVFGDEYTPDISDPINAEVVVRGGSGYAIRIVDGKEVYDHDADHSLPPGIDHIYPDYDLYGITDTAYGFLTKGCPRNCPFCHVGRMQGCRVYTFAHLNEFWHGQKNIKLLDPNLTASRDYFEHMTELAESKASIDFTQGLDARVMTVEKIRALNDVKWKRIHFAWDRPKDNLEPIFERIAEHLNRCNKNYVSAYVLTNFDSTFEQDLYRVTTLRRLNIQPYVMIYRKQTAPRELKMLQRWCSPFIFWKCDSFEDYKGSFKNDKPGRPKKQK